MTHGIRLRLEAHCARDIVLNLWLTFVTLFFVVLDPLNGVPFTELSSDARDVLMPYLVTELQRSLHALCCALDRRRGISVALVL